MLLRSQHPGLFELQQECGRAPDQLVTVLGECAPGHGHHLRRERRADVWLRALHCCGHLMLKSLRRKVTCFFVMDVVQTGGKWWRTECIVLWKRGNLYQICHFLPNLSQCRQRSLFDKSRTLNIKFPTQSDVVFLIDLIKIVMV